VNVSTTLLQEIFERGMPRAINLLYSLIINFLQRLVRWLSVMNFAHWKTSVRG
jgi:3-deoxy-D-arabino-heptulosonate 7-phosphate (DAHP) synthase